MDENKFQFCLNSNSLNSLEQDMKKKKKIKFFLRSDIIIKKYINLLNQNQTYPWPMGIDENCSLVFLTQLKKTLIAKE